MRNNSEARWESCHLSHLSLSSEDLEFAANAFNNARYAVVNIELSNNGQATARNVSIIHPDAFRLSGTEEKFDLLPGQSRSIMLETENLAPLQGSIQVVYDRETSLFVDSQNVSLIGGSFIVIWFISVLLSISYSFFDIDSLFDKPPELYSQQRDAVTISSVRHMLTRMPISRGQRALYKLLYMAGDKGLSSSELATATGWSKSQLSGVLGALGRRVNDTEGFERNRGIEEILETSLLDDGDSHYRMRSVLREALEAESLV